MQVNAFIEEAKSGTPFNFPGNSGGNAVSINPVSSMFLAGSAPPLSPRSPSASPRFVKRGAGSGRSPLSSPLRLFSEKLEEVIPQVFIIL